MLSLWRFQGKKFNKLIALDSILLAIVGLTIVYGAFVAGLKAGLIYNTFPLMGGDLIPSEWSFYTPIWVNFINNGAMVQFIHRLLAILAITYAWFLWGIYGNKYRMIAIKLSIQVVLGIATLLLNVPLVLALVHQVWAMVVWLVSLRTVALDQRLN